MLPALPVLLRVVPHSPNLARLHGYAVVSLVTPFLYPRWVPLPAQNLAVV